MFGSSGAPLRRDAPPLRLQRTYLLLELRDPLFQLLVLERQLPLARRQVTIVTPPVKADLLCLIERTNEKPNANREKLDFGEGNFYVARYHQALV
jgi:hypothetical protein